MVFQRPHNPNPRKYTVRNQEAWLARQARWRHNGLNGSVRMARSNMEAIQRAPTTTLATKEIAANIERQLYALQEALRYRVESDGSVKFIYTPADQELEDLANGH